MKTSILPFDHAKTIVAEPPVKTKPALDLEVLAAVATATFKRSLSFTCIVIMIIRRKGR